jgi:transposase InsO family protein
MPVLNLCRLLEVHPSGYYAWRARPRSQRAIANERLTGLIKQFWLESIGIYGYRKIHSDLRSVGERCGKHRVRRLMSAAGLPGSGRLSSPAAAFRARQHCCSEPVTATVYRGPPEQSLGDRHNVYPHA